MIRSRGSQECALGDATDRLQEGRAGIVRPIPGRQIDRRASRRDPYRNSITGTLQDRIISVVVLPMIRLRRRVWP